MNKKDYRRILMRFILVTVFLVVIAFKYADYQSKIVSNYTELCLEYIYENHLVSKEIVNYEICSNSG